MIRLSQIQFGSALKSLKSHQLNKSSYQIIGHILNINRNDDNEFGRIPLEIKQKIAEEILSDKSGNFKNIKTIVESDGRQITDDNEYSVKKMRLLAGVDNYETFIMENQTKFYLNYEKCYYNVKRQKLHKLVMDKIRQEASDKENLVLVFLFINVLI